MNQEKSLRQQANDRSKGLGALQTLQETLLNFQGNRGKVGDRKLKSTSSGNENLTGLLI